MSDLDSAATAGLRSALLKWLSNRQITVAPNSALHDVALRAFNVLRRTLPSRPWSVVLSNHLQQSAAFEEFEPAIRSIAERALHGETLTPYQSLSINDPEYDDDLLNDWGIHHLHLGLESHPRNPSHRARTKDLLFVYPWHSDLLLLAILPHGRWESSQLIEVLHSEFPEAIRAYRIEGISIEYKPTESERRQLRSSVVVWTVTADGTVYFPLGGGTATSGRSIRAVDAALRLQHEYGPRALRRHLESSKQALSAGPYRVEYEFTDDLQVSTIVIRSGQGCGLG